MLDDIVPPFERLLALAYIKKGETCAREFLLGDVGIEDMGASDAYHAGGGRFLSCCRNSQ